MSGGSRFPQQPRERGSLGAFTFPETVSDLTSTYHLVTQQRPSSHHGHLHWRRQRPDSRPKSERSFSAQDRKLDTVEAAVLGPGRFKADLPIVLDGLGLSQFSRRPPYVGHES